MASQESQFHHDELASAMDKVHEEEHEPHIAKVEKVVQMLSALPNSYKARELATGYLIKKLWYQLDHPPRDLLGHGPDSVITIDSDSRYRSANGSNNNPNNPSLGAAGSRYARTTQARRPKLAQPPDPADVFDKLLLRTGPPRTHPNDVFHTDERDQTRAKGSSYLDLAPLYGHDQVSQDTVREFKDGLLKKDTFAEYRLLGQPPGVCAFIVAFNRFHNHVVVELARINEGGRFSLPRGLVSGSDAELAALKTRDNDSFQHGRLITCGLYVNIILHDYIRAILNLNQNTSNVESDWSLDPRLDFPHLNVPKAVGNQVSVEFNLVYRWHATINTANENWTNNFMREVFGETYNPKTLSAGDFMLGARRWAEGILLVEPSQRTFGGIERLSNGAFADDSLINILNHTTESPAAAFGAKSTPLLMRPIEILGIETQRQWGVATLNEVREKFNLTPHKTFQLYPEPDDIEFYPGIQAEETKKPWFPGSGLCPGVTISVAILADAVALCRGDRFYTTDYTPDNLTEWGFHIASSSFGKVQGGVLYKLLETAFPGRYKDNSVWSLYPLTIPEKNREILSKHKVVEQFDFEKPQLRKQYFD
ncbi:heme peroxidase [Mollisia scopiformis]|uniref:Heme peroxidase n=1 Tax=Mollisia scopiformis TaxID=149040 RepID=A0A194X7G8_MOLSC|nr:heme peroxidase [Mollisia scopiformis]KUJ16115.1 heme peroxidase [Mollisia scopiformis]